jgi:hypothetical protein
VLETSGLAGALEGAGGVVRFEIGRPVAVPSTRRCSLTKCSRGPPRVCLTGLRRLGCVDVTVVAYGGFELDWG